MATTWSNPKVPGEGVRAALASCTTGTEVATAGATDGLDLRGLSGVAPHLETAAKASGTIRVKGMKPGDTVTVNGQVFTAVSRSANPGAAEFRVGSDVGPDNGNDYTTARNLAAVIQANGVGASVGAFCDKDEALVTVFALADGAAGNAFNLLTSSARAVVSGATLAGGAAAGVIGAGASLQAYLLNLATGRWNRAYDLDQPLQAGLASQALPVLPTPGFPGRLQMVPNAVGVPCFVYLDGLAGRIP
jgi:hypothetical protein